MRIVAARGGHVNALANGREWRRRRVEGNGRGGHRAGRPVVVGRGAGRRKRDQKVEVRARTEDGRLRAGAARAAAAETTRFRSHPNSKRNVQIYVRLFVWVVHFRRRHTRLTRYLCVADFLVPFEY